jgi:hypothetical protein
MTMKFYSLLLAAVFVFTATQSANAIVIDVGSHVLQANTGGQAIQIAVQFETGDPNVTGLNLSAQIGDGTSLLTDPEPVFDGTPGTFDGLDLTGSIWTANSNSVSGNGVPRITFPQLASGSITFDNSGDDVTPDGLLLTFLVDTAGFSSGTFDLSFQGTELGDTTFILQGGGSIAPNITNGSITIVPEPSSGILILIGMGVLAFGARCSRRRVRSQLVMQE